MPAAADEPAGGGRDELQDLAYHSPPHIVHRSCRHCAGVAHRGGEGVAHVTGDQRRPALERPAHGLRLRDRLRRAGGPGDARRDDHHVPVHVQDAPRRGAGHGLVRERQLPRPVGDARTHGRGAARGRRGREHHHHGGDVAHQRPQHLAAAWWELRRRAVDRRRGYDRAGPARHRFQVAGHSAQRSVRAAGLGDTADRVVHR
mmetsp:Transcript_85796/g.262510  ORF Transcript_85796/g.262510 Transcript_85796/m.262510 type:complete len:202 (-) Transcript_85796:24-629(-)